MTNETKLLLALGDAHEFIVALMQAASTDVLNLLDGPVGERVETTMREALNEAYANDYTIEDHLDDCVECDGPECPGCTHPGNCVDCEYQYDTPVDPVCMDCATAIVPCSKCSNQGNTNDE